MQQQQQWRAPENKALEEALQTAGEFPLRKKKSLETGCILKSGSRRCKSVWEERRVLM